MYCPAIFARVSSCPSPMRISRAEERDAGHDELGDDEDDEAALEARPDLAVAPGAVRLGHHRLLPRREPVVDRLAHHVHVGNGERRSRQFLGAEVPYERLREDVVRELRDVEGVHGERVERDAPGLAHEPAESARRETRVVVIILGAFVSLTRLPGRR